MSDTVLIKDASELKAGRAPAIRVGGMRVGGSRPRQTSQGDDKEKSVEANQKDVNKESGNNDDNDDRHENGDNLQTADQEHYSGSLSNRVAGQMVSGIFVPVQKAFPTEAVKHTHEKPGSQPKHAYHSHAKHDEQRFLNQPRKQ